MKEAKDIEAACKAWYPRPATTVQQIGQLRQKLLELEEDRHCLFGARQLEFGNFLQANPHKDPFVIRLYNRIPPADRRAAYLWAVDGRAEWRYAVRDTGLQTCPLVYHAPLAAMLDRAFRMHLHALKKQVWQPPYEPPTPVTDRLAWVTTQFLCGSQPDREELLWQYPAVTVHQMDSCHSLADECRLSLGADAGRFGIEPIGPDPCRGRILGLHFLDELYFLDIELPGNPALNVLICVNRLLYPHYEVRKYRGPESAECMHCITLALHEWCALESRFGEAAVGAVFEPITCQTALPVIDPWGDNDE